MRGLLTALGLVLAACGTAAPGGTLGLPSAGPSASTAAPTPQTPPAAPSGSATPSGSPSAAPSPPTPTPRASATGTPTPPTTAPPTPTPKPAPGIIAATATQVSLTVAYTAPMRAALDCGTSGTPLAVDGAIDDPSTVRYRSSDRAFDESLASATRAAVSADCTTVTFLFGLAAPAGTFTITAMRVKDREGHDIDPTRAQAQVSIADQERPRAIGAAASGDSISVTFNEPMLKIGEGGGVTLFGNYRLDGGAAPITSIGCNDEGCRSIRIALRAGTLLAGRTYELRIANVVDRAGRNLTPDPTTLAFRAGS